MCNLIHLYKTCCWCKVRHSLFIANTEQIDAAKEVLKKLQFTYSSESFENPVLQKHWRNIEALALDQDAPEEMTDYTCTFAKCFNAEVSTIVFNSNLVSNLFFGQMG